MPGIENQYNFKYSSTFFDWYIRFKLSICHNLLSAAIATRENQPKLKYSATNFDQYKRFMHCWPAGQAGSKAIAAV